MNIIYSFKFTCKQISENLKVSSNTKMIFYGGKNTIKQKIFLKICIYITTFKFGNVTHQQIKIHQHNLKRNKNHNKIFTSK